MVTKFEQRIKQLLGKSEESDKYLQEAVRHVQDYMRSERYMLAEIQADSQAIVARQGQLELLKAKLKAINASKIFVLERMIKTTVNERILYAQSEINNGRSNVERKTPQAHAFDYSRLMNLKHPKGTPGYLPATANIREESEAEAKKIIDKLKAEVDVHGNPKSFSNKQQDAYARRLYEFLNDARVKNQRGELETPEIYLGDNFKTNHGVNERGNKITKYKGGFVDMTKSPISSTQSDWLLLLFWDPDAGHALRSLSFDMQNELTKELEDLKRRAERTKAGSGERAVIADEQRRINRDLKIAEDGLYFSRLLLTFHAAREEIGRTSYIDVTTETTSGEDFVSGGVLVEGRGQTPTRKPFQIDSHLPTVNLGGIQQNVARFKSIAEMFHGFSGFQESIGARSAAQIPASQLPYSTQAKLESDMLGGGDDLYDDRDIFSPAPSSLDDINLSDQPIGRDEDLAQRVAKEEGISIEEARQKVSYDIQNPADAIEEIGRQMDKLFETGIVDSIIYRLTTEVSSDKNIKGRSVVLKRNPFGKDNIVRNSLQAQIQKSLLSGILSSSQPKILNQLRTEKTNIPKRMAPSPENFATAGETLHVRGLLKRLDQLQQIPVKQAEVEVFRGKSKYPEVTSVEMPTKKHLKTKRRKPKYGRSMVSDDLITVLNEIETAQEYDAVMSALQSIYYEVNSPERKNKSNTPAKIAERLGGKGKYKTIIKELSQIMKHQVEGFHYQETSRKPGPSGQKRSLASWYMVVKQEKRKGNNYQLVPMKSTFESRLVTRTGKVIAGETNVPTRSLRLPPGAKVEQGGTRTHQDWVESRGQLDTTAEMELFDQMSNEELRKVYSDLKTESAKAFSNRAIRDLAKQKGITKAQAEAELLAQQPSTIRLGPGGLASPYDAATAQREYIPPSPRRVPAKSYDNIPIGYTPSILQPDTDMTKVDPDFFFRDLVFNPAFTDEELKHRNNGKAVDKANLPQYRDIYSAYLGQQTFDLDAKLQIANASTIEEKVAILDRLAKHDKNAKTSDKKLVNASTWKNVRGRVMRTLVRMQMTVPQVASASAARTTLRTGKGQFQFANTPLESDANQFWGQTTDKKDRPNRSDGNMYGQLHADARREMPGESRYGQDSIMPKDISTGQLASMMQDPSQWEFQPDGQRPIDNILDKVTYSQIKNAGIQLGLSEAELTLGNRTKDDIVRMVQDQLGLSIDTKPSPQAEEFIKVILTAFDDPDAMTEIPEEELMGGGANNQIDIQTEDDISRIANEVISPSLVDTVKANQANARTRWTLVEEITGNDPQKMQQIRDAVEAGELQIAFNDEGKVAVSVVGQKRHLDMLKGPWRNETERENKVTSSDEWYDIEDNNPELHKKLEKIREARGKQWFKGEITQIFEQMLEVAKGTPLESVIREQLKPDPTYDALHDLWVGTGDGEPPKDPPPVAGGMEDDGMNKIKQEIEDWLVNQGFKTKKKESIRRAIAAGNESYLANNLNKSQLKSLLLGMGKQPGPKATKKSMAAQILVTTGNQAQAVAPPPSSQSQPAVQPTTETVSGPSALAPAPNMGNPLEGTRWADFKVAEIGEDLASGLLSYGSLNEKEKAFINSPLAKKLREDYERGVFGQVEQQSAEDVIRNVTGEQGNTINKVVSDEAQSQIDFFNEGRGDQPYTQREKDRDLIIITEGGVDPFATEEQLRQQAEEIRARQQAATPDLSGPPDEIGNTLESVLPIGDSGAELERRRANRPDVSPTTDATTDPAIDPITGELLGEVGPGEMGPGQMQMPDVTPTTEPVSAPPPNVNQPDVTPTAEPVSDPGSKVWQAGYQDAIGSYGKENADQLYAAGKTWKDVPVHIRNTMDPAKRHKLAAAWISSLGASSSASPNVNPTTQSIPYGDQDRKSGDTGPTYKSQVKPPPGINPTTAQVPDQQAAGQTTQSSQPSLNDVASQGETETPGKIRRAANWTKDKVDQGSNFAKRSYQKAQAIQKSPLVSGATDIGEALSGFQTAAEWNKLSDLERAEAESSRTYDLSKGQYGSMEQLTSTMVSRNQISQQDADNLNRLASYIREDVKASPDAFNNRPENHPAWNHLMSSLRNATLNENAYKGRTAVFRQPISYDDMSWKDQVIRGKETEGMFGSLREDLINKPMDIRDKVPEGLINVVGLSEATGQRQSISYLSDMVKQNIAYMATMNVTGSMKDSLSKWTNVALRKIPMEALGAQGAEVLGEEVIKYLKARKVKNLDKIVDGMKGMSATAIQELGERYGMKNVKETVKDGLIKKVAKFGLKGAVRVLEIPLMANHLRDEISAMTDPSMQGWQRSLRTTIGGAPIESEAGHEAVLMRPDAFTEVMAARSSGQYSNDQLQQMMYDGAPYSNVSMWSLDEDAGVVINNRTGTEVSLKEVNGRIPGYVKKYNDEKLRMLNMTALKFLGRSALDDEEAEQIRGRMMRTEFSDLTQSEVSELEKEFTTRGKGYTAGFSDDEMQGYDLLNPNENRISQRDAGWSYSFKKGGGLEGLDDRFTLKDLSDVFSEPTAQGESVVGKGMDYLIPDWDWNINPMSALSAAEQAITRKTGDRGERLWKNRTMVFYPETTTAEGNVLPSKMQPYESGHIMDIGQHAEDIASPFTKSDAQRYGQYYIDPTDVGHIESEEQSKRRAQEFGGLAPPPAGALIPQPHWQGLR